MQLPPAASEEPQVLAEIANGPVATAEVMGRAALPALVRVAVIAVAVVLMTVDGKARDAVSAACGTVATPVPATVAVWVPTLSVTLTLAANNVAEPGVKVMLTEQLAPAARVVPQLLVWAKTEDPVPVMVTEPIPVMAPVPVLVSTSVCGAEVVETVVAGKFNDNGANEASPTPLTVPLRVAICVVGDALSVTTTLAE